MLNTTNATKLTIKNDSSKIEALLGPRLYSDPYSFISEVLQNATDSHRKANNLATPIEAGLKKENGSFYFYVRDKGTSFESKEEFVRLACTLLESSKSQVKTKDMLQEMGKYGIGKLSPAAYYPKWDYIVYNEKNSFTSQIEYIEGKGAFHKESDYFTTKPEEKGVHFQIKINNVDAFYKNFINKVRYFENIYITIGLECFPYISERVEKLVGINERFNLFRNDIFQYSTLSTFPEMEICLDQYAYKIDWQRLGIESIRLPIALYFSMDDFEVNPTREVITIDENYRKRVLERIELFYQYVVDEYNTKNPATEYTNIIYYLHNEKHKKNYIEIDSLNINLELLPPRFLKKLNQNSFKDVSPKTINMFRGSLSHHSNNSLANVFNLYKKTTNKNTLTTVPYHAYERDLNFLLVDSKIDHNNRILWEEKIPKKVLNFLKNEGTSYFLYKDNRHLLTKVKPNSGEISLQFLVGHNYESYSKLGEDSFSKKTIDILMDEYTILINSFADFLNSWTTIKVPENYEKKTITQISIAREQINLRSMANKDRFNLNISYSESKLTYLDDLHKIHHICVYGNETKKDKLAFIEKLGAYSAKNNINTYLIADRYQKRIETVNPKNFIEVDDFIDNKHKLFKKLVTGYKIQRELREKYQLVFQNVPLIKDHISKSFAEDLEKVIKYSNEYNLHYDFRSDSSKTLKEIMSVAKEYELFDLDMLATMKNIEKNIEKFDFLEYFESFVSSGNEAKKTKAIKTMIELVKARKIKMDSYHYNFKLKGEEDKT